ncbi:MAG: sigma-70 family RNA polymerase sigma factor [Planctomycetota bacterium]
MSEFESLLIKARSGDSSAVESLLQRHLAGLHGFVRLRLNRALRRRESSSDLVQSVCLQAIQNLDALRGESEAAFKQWLYAIALRKILDRQDYHGAQKRDVGREVAWSVDAQVDDAGALGRYVELATPSHQAMTREAIESIESALDRLPHEYREVLTLSRIMGFSGGELAKQIGKTEVATRKLLSRARARLAMFLVGP